MNRQDVARSLIELAVDQGIKDMKSDSHRTLRRLTDLGRQFAKGRFQSYIFALFQRLLAQDDSPYYEMIDRLLTQTDAACVKRFGINAGYNGWTWGASVLRQKRAESGIEYPWLLPLIWYPSSGFGMTIRDLSSLVAQNRKNGTYCYCIRTRGALEDNTEIFRLFSAFPDCAFLLELSDSDCCLGPRQLQEAARCSNLMVLLPHAAKSSRQTARALLSQRSLFAISFRYCETDMEKLLDGSLICDLLSYGSVLLCLQADPGCPKKVRQAVSDFVLEARMAQKYPALLAEWDTDLARIDRIIFDSRLAAG